MVRRSCILLFLVLGPLGLFGQASTFGVAGGPVFHNLLGRSAQWIGFGYGGSQPWVDHEGWSFEYLGATALDPSGSPTLGLGSAIHFGLGRSWPDDFGRGTASLGPSLVLATNPSNPQAYTLFGGVGTLVEHRSTFGDGWTWSVGVFASLAWVAIGPNQPVVFPVNVYWLEPRLGVSWNP